MELAKRSCCRSQLTKTINGINSMLTKDCSVEDLQAAIAKLKLVSENLKEADRLVQPLVKENLEEEFTKILEYEETAVNLQARLEYKRQSIEKTSINVNNQTQMSSPLSNIKLQRQELIKLDGSPKSWIAFWEQFKNVVHENAQLTDGDEFNYLKMSVTGKAAEAIEGFPPSGDFYREAITTLKEQFGNSEELIAQYFETIMNLEPVQSKQDIKGLRRIYNVVTSSVRALEVLKVPLSQYNIMFKSSLLKALPTELKLSYFRQEKHKEADTDERASLVSDNSSNNDQMKCLLKFLRYELESLAQVYKHDGLKENNTHDNKQLQSGRKGTATSLLTSQNKETCLFCEGFHKTELCDANILLSKKKEVENGIGFKADPDNGNCVTTLDWFLDSGATDHNMINKAKCGESITARTTGNVRGCLVVNSEMETSGLKTVFENSKAVIYKQSEIVRGAKRQRGLYELEIYLDMKTANPNLSLHQKEDL
ncbi:hypothetical protein ILUMI_10557 [Ignelater luminosus]|uniref:Uncharacterized protein n=1 Tax=Ignelater luminosus TaxID=2038154 RepID=A0A8K0GBC9_IGNLU|nr:hypothetical protein ILUMI_10557 [Ignelater luminosus]